MNDQLNLMNRFFAGKASREDADALADWIGEDESRKKEFDKAYRLFLISNFTLESPEFQERLSQMRLSRARRLRTVVIGAVAAASLAVGVLVTHFVERRAADRKMAATTLVSEAKPGQQSKVTLSDGTVVELNSGSRLVYPAIFGRGERKVRLEGEALFDVNHDEEHPFIVETYAYNVKVLGTKFNVLAIEEGDEFCATLLEGKIEIQSPSGEREALLDPGMSASRKDGKLREGASSDTECLWTEGIISAAGVDFKTLMDRMERAYGVKIQIDCDKMPVLRYKRLKLRISNGIEYAFNALLRNADFDYTYDEETNTYHII